MKQGTCNYGTGVMLQEIASVVWQLNLRFSLCWAGPSIKGPPQRNNLTLGLFNCFNFAHLVCRPVQQLHYFL